MENDSNLPIWMRGVDGGGEGGGDTGIRGRGTGKEGRGTGKRGRETGE